MPSCEHAVHNGTAEGRRHAEADEHDGRDQLGQKAEKRVGVTCSRHPSSQHKPCKAPLLPGLAASPPPPRPNSAAPGGLRSCWAFHTADWGLLTPGASAGPVNKRIIKQSAVSCYCKLCDKDPACVLCTNLAFCVGISAGRALEPTGPHTLSRTRLGLCTLASESATLSRKEALPVFTPSSAHLLRPKTCFLLIIRCLHAAV